MSNSYALALHERQLINFEVPELQHFWQHSDRFFEPKLLFPIVSAETDTRMIQFRELVCRKLNV